MHFSSTSGCCSYVKSALNWSRLGLYFEVGAPGQSTLKSGLPMSVTRSWYFVTIFCASAISADASFIRFLFHRPRTSIHCIPNSRAATWHAWSKSWEISSVITATRKGDFHLGVSFFSVADILDGRPLDKAVRAINAPVPPRKSRRVNSDNSASGNRKLAEACASRTHH